MEFLFLENAVDSPVQESLQEPRINSRRTSALNPIPFLQDLLEKGGPDLYDYPMLDNLMEIIFTAQNGGSISKSDINETKKIFSEEYLMETIHGYGYRKPLGYAGDFLMIDKIYTNYKTENPRFTKWDEYFHYCEATQAVRNRKEFFKKQMLEKLAGSKETLSLLDVASGPARDLMELYQRIDSKTLKTTCVDMDAQAIEYAKGLCQYYSSQIEFHNKNIFRFSTEKKFDVIWSSGLFDYFEDRFFVLALKRFLKWLKPGGEIIVGNFSEDNSSRGYMEVFGEWFLIHRSKEELIRLAKSAGVSENNICVDSEELGVNLFLRIKN